MVFKACETMATVNGNSPEKSTQEAEEAAREAERSARESAREAEESARELAQKVEKSTREPAQQEEWLRQDRLTYGALMAVSLIMVQPFLTAVSLDLTAQICIIAFSVAIPLLAALVMVNRQE